MVTKASKAGGKKPFKKTVAPAKPTASPVAEKKAVVEPKVVAAPVVAKAIEPVAKAVTATVEAAPKTAIVPEIAPKAAIEAVEETASKEIVNVVAETAAEAVEQVAQPVENLIKDAAPELAAVANKGTDIMEATIEKTQAVFADLNDRAKVQVEKNTKLVAEATEFAKGNVEALVESGKIAAKGLETIGQDAAEYSRKSFESATAALKSMSAVKSPADFFKLQSDFVRSSMDALVAESTKNTEAFMKLAGDAAQPVSSRFAVAVEKVKAAA
ncbi:phasin family protein [Sphingomonas sp. LT1P40]|uniref:phasin family protein n=1 Tax=Alteristakelama amylovorans TaxID=3096166 RepID=UPI002FCBA207